MDVRSETCRTYHGKKLLSLRLRHNVALRQASDQEIGGGTARAIGRFLENFARHWARGIFNLK
jgi:hypothetical protein